MTTPDDSHHVDSLRLTGEGTAQASTAHDPGDDAGWEAERSSDRDPVGTWRFLIREAERIGNHAQAERLRRGGHPPEPGPPPGTFAPIIVAVDVGSDPGGAVAVAVAATAPNLRLVVVLGGADAARFTRRLLDLMGREDVPVVAGSASAPGASAITGLVPTEVPNQPTDVLEMVNAVTTSTRYLIRWANAAPLTDLAAVLRADPGLARRLECSIAAAPLGVVPPWFAADPASATYVMTTLEVPAVEAHDPSAALGPPAPSALVTLDESGHTLAPGSVLQQRLAGGPAWARLLADHADQWFAQGHAGWTLSPAVTVANSIGVPYIHWVPTVVSLDPDGRVIADPNGRPMETADHVRDYFIRFDDWLVRTLTDDW